MYGGLESSGNAGLRQSEKNGDPNFDFLICLFFLNFQAELCTKGNGALCWG
jgi:hypothetical protein